MLTLMAEAENIPLKGYYTLLPYCFFFCQKKADHNFEISRGIFNETCSNFESNPGHHFPIDSRGIFAPTPTLHPQIVKIGQNFDQNHQFWCIFGFSPSTVCPRCLEHDIDPKSSGIVFKLCLGSQEHIPVCFPAHLSLLRAQTRKIDVDLNGRSREYPFKDLLTMSLQ